MLCHYNTLPHPYPIWHKCILYAKLARFERPRIPSSYPGLLNQEMPHSLSIICSDKKKVQIFWIFSNTFCGEWEPKDVHEVDGNCCNWMCFLWSIVYPVCTFCFLFHLNFEFYWFIRIHSLISCRHWAFHFFLRKFINSMCWFLILYVFFFQFFGRTSWIPSVMMMILKLYHLLVQIQWVSFCFQPKAVLLSLNASACGCLWISA